MSNEGDVAPDVTLVMTDGTSKPLSAWRGRKLVLYFYPKDDTSGCTAEAQAFTSLAGDFDTVQTAVVGVSKDASAKHAKFIAKYDLKVALATDADNVCEAFGVWAEKSMYGKKYMGIERATFLIDADGRIAKAWRKVKVPGHAEAVLAAARAL